jgi:ubiquinone biosynthesis accessory factor UbiJ
MPESTPSTFAAKSFCAALNHLLAREGWAREQLLAYAGKTARLEFPPFSIGMQVDPHGLLVAWPSAAPAPEPGGEEARAPGHATVTENAATHRYDVTITASANAASAFLQGGQAAAMKYVKIDGDAEFASTIARLAEHLRWEPEEDLAQLIGDAPAHQLAGQVRDALTQARRSGQSLLESVAEYFLDENPQLVRHASLEQMRGELVSLRDAVARLEKRIERVAQKAPVQPGSADHTTRPTRSAADTKSSDRPS